ncbi:MAG: hypothetical protein A2663_04800 [Candidatus Buchananbacteria bacterium RIFCSPHIGHO2_01_FULL_46_12]|uniref:Methyltransferase type 11 domain-containing protein n=2 Tax=Candidatus Buchananiibacteriota TaxID=1817903 RepID=A0A1G1Y9R6_9BACT|nr:MAG: hypothetical protein A2663_04800 [Candidatus Buchananbacteria bacterium RIFCSPHIGHO2_01_FULL_46_12]OGY55564.1 MAG: hypothetical protein A3H67_02920 [Candidatus Buchananbacteria bacterium RIFCSPLOWO2_02_FULL_46_11b]
MEKHTKIGLGRSWSQKAAASRANRKASSAPLPLELKKYEFALRQALKGKRSPKVMVLGATPELRDLAIRLGATCLAVDISQDMLVKMSEVMKYKNDPKNLIARGDWLKLAEIFKSGGFDAILADASLNNVPYKFYDLALKNIWQLLKPGGAFITRHFVYLFDKPKDGIEEMQKKYDSGRLNWVWLVVHIGSYSHWHQQFYNRKTNTYLVGRGIKLLDGWLKNKKFKFNKSDLEKFENLKLHAGNVNHVVAAENEWLALIKKYFTIKDRLVVQKYEWMEYAPVWHLRKK